MQRIYNAFQRSSAGRTFVFVDASFMGVSDGIALKKGERETAPVKKTKYHKRLNIINAANVTRWQMPILKKGTASLAIF